MTNLPWHRPEEKPMDHQPLVICANGFIETGSYWPDEKAIVLERADSYDDAIKLSLESIGGWLYASDLLADFTRWQSASDTQSAGSVEQGWDE